MPEQRKLAFLQERLDSIRQWLDDNAPYTEHDQRHLDANTPERAYWHHGYQAALADVIALLTPSEQKSGSGGSSA
jgi:hypothetical protein